MAALILKGNIDLKIAAGYGCVDGGDNAGCDQLHHRPLRMFQHNQGKLATFKILLIADIFVSGHHEVKPGLLGSFDQCAVGEFFSSMRPRLFNRVANEIARQTARRAIVKKNAHEASA